MNIALLPDSLSQVDQSEQIRQAFGWAPGIFGTYALANVVLLAIQEPKVVDTLFLLFPLGVGILLWGFEWYRRANKAIYVRKDSVIGLYKRGKKIETLNVSQLSQYVLNPFRSALQLIFIGSIVVVLFYKGLLQTVDPVLSIAVVFYGSLGLVFVASVFRVRFILKYFRYQAGILEKEIAVKPSQVEALTGRPSAGYIEST